MQGSIQGKTNFYSYISLNGIMFSLNSNHCERKNALDNEGDDFIWVISLERTLIEKNFKEKKEGLGF